MKSGRAAITLSRIFNICFFTAFALVLLCIVIFGYENETDGNTYNCSLRQHAGILIAAVFLTLIFSVAYILINRLWNSGKIKRIPFFQNTGFAVLAIVGTMFLLQLAAGRALAFKPVTDVEIIDSYALDFAYTGGFDKIQSDYANSSVYMARYPNNFAILFLLSFLYRINYLLTGEISQYLPIYINSFAINISVLLTVLLARRLFGDGKAVFVLLLCLLFAPYYTYAAYYYTDSLSMPLFIGAVYLFASALRRGAGRKRYLLLSVCGAIAFLGFKLKGSVIILPAVLLIYAVVRYSVKRAAAVALALIFGFGAAMGVYSAAFNNARIVTREQSEASEYPPTHWVMMGLKGYGTYSVKDSNFTASFSNKAEKARANLEEIKSRLQSYGVTGLARHTAKKVVWTWEDGTYYISHHIEKALNRNFLHSFVLNDGSRHYFFYAYSCGFQLFLILMMIFSAAKGTAKPQINAAVLLRGLVFCALVFFLVWETRSRYLFNFTPIFILLSADGIDFFTGRAARLKKTLNRKTSV